MKKLKFKEIIDVLKEYSTVESFCIEDYFLITPKNIMFSDGLKSKINTYEKAYQEWENNGRPWSKDNKYYQAWKSNPKPYTLIQQEILNYLGLGNVKKVDSYGGEDCGSTHYSIKHFIDHNVYIKVSGWYQSHYGTHFGSWEDACEEVKPKVKQITVYE